jgi:hypothetical protein
MLIGQLEEVAKAILCVVLVFWTENDQCRMMRLCLVAGSPGGEHERYTRR